MGHYSHVFVVFEKDVKIKKIPEMANKKGSNFIWDLSVYFKAKMLYMDEFRLISEWRML